MAQYGPGTSLTCDTSQGNAIITFSVGAELTTYVEAGDWFTLDDDDSPTKEIESVDSNTQLTLSSPWTGSTLSDQYFVISTDFTSRKGYPIFHQGDKRVGKNLARLVNALDDDMVRLELDTVCVNNLSYSGEWGLVTIDSGGSVGAPLYIDSSGHYKQADADLASTMPCIALALTDETGDNKKVLFRGFLKNTSWSWTPRATLYVSNTSGELTETAPAGSGDRVQVVAYAVSATLIHFNPTYYMTVV